MVVAVPVAVLAGLVSFFSPCVIPLLPGYLSYTTGLSGADLADSEAKPRRGRMLAGSSLFVLGFSVVFVGLGVMSAGVSRWFFENSRTLTIVLGVFAIVLGLVFMGLVPLFQRDVRVHKVPAVGLAAAPMLGFLFDVGPDALHRPDARGHRRLGELRKPSAGASCWRSSLDSASRSSSRRWPGAARSARSRSSAGTSSG